MQSKIKFIFTAIFSLLALAGCQPKGGGSAATSGMSGTASSSSQSSGGSGGGTTSSPTPAAPAAIVLGARNFDEINATMESVTGVMGNKNVINRFTSLKSQLPGSSNIQAVGFSNQGATTVLAAEYCTALIQNSGNMYSTQLTAIFGTFSFAATPSVAFAGTAPATLAQDMIMSFWGPGYASNSNLAAAEQGVEQLISTLTAGLPNTATTTKNAVIGACTSVLASAPVSVF